MQTVNEKCPVKDWDYFGIALSIELNRQTGLKWKPEPKPEDYRPEYVVLTSDTGAKLVFSMLWNKPERVEITGQFPKGFDRRYDELSYEITVSLTKSVAQIVREVKRRLFEQKGYSARLAEALLLEEATWDEAARVKRERCEFFATLLNGSLNKDRNGVVSGARTNIVGASPARAEFQVNSNDVSIEIRWCPTELAEQLAVLIKGYNSNKA